MPTQPLPRRYRVWVAALTLSQAGDAVLYFVIGWAATAYGGAAAGLVLAGMTLPRAVLLLLGGVVADRAGPRAVLLAADLALAACVVGAAAAAALLGSPLWLLAALAVAVGTATAASFPAAGALPGRLVAPVHLPRAMALQNAGQQLAMLGGGPLGGLLVAVGGPAAALGADALTFLPVLVVTAALRLRPAGSPVRSWRGEALDGLRVAARSPALRLVLALYAVAGGFAVPLEALLVPVLARERGWSAAVAGLVAGGIAAGMFAGALVIARRGTHPRAGRAAGAGLFAVAAGSMLLLLPWPAAAVAAACLAGLGLAAFIAHAGPVLLTRSPQTHLARVQALRGLVQSITLMGSNALLGLLAHAGAGVALVAVALVLTGAGAVAATRPALRTS